MIERAEKQNNAASDEFCQFSSHSSLKGDGEL